MYRIFFRIQKEHWWFVTKKRIVLDSINRHFTKYNDVKILDIGCGSGLMLNALENLGKTYGMDMSDEAINFSKEIYTGPVLKGGLPTEIPFEENFFDIITALDVIEHVDLDVESLKTIHSRLTTKGIAVITVPAYMFLWSSFDEINNHKRRYTRNELNLKLVESGFKVIKISYYNTLLFPLILIIRVINNLLKRNAESDVDMPNKFINYILKIIFGLEKYLLRITNFPFGVSILAVVKK
jgi:2-polyprenyl-3-methyl-5-hydroxy-6-metoxy-1,4-benzoquinol methylase